MSLAGVGRRLQHMNMNLLSKSQKATKLSKLNETELFTRKFEPGSGLLATKSGPSVLSHTGSPRRRVIPSLSQTRRNPSYVIVWILLILKSKRGRPLAKRRLAMRSRKQISVDFRSFSSTVTMLPPIRWNQPDMGERGKHDFVQIGYRGMVFIGSVMGFVPATKDSLNEMKEI
jgi:hypothetical protein